MKTVYQIVALFCLTLLVQSTVAQGQRDTIVTLQNYREHPISQWAFRNAGVPLHVLMIPRSGTPHNFKEKFNTSVGSFECVDTEGERQRFEDLFYSNYADGVVVVKDNTIVFEKYWNGMTRDDHHIWFSLSKSLASAAFGILMEQHKIDLLKSPSEYIPALNGSAYARASVQDILNMSSALGFEENYTDTSSFFTRYYGSAINMQHVPGASTNEGIHSFLTTRAFPNRSLQPGFKFEYNSTNVDVISWIISKMSGKPYHEFVRENIWAKIGAAHDAFVVADRTNSAVATSGMNSTLRDAALFGQLILNRGAMDNKQIIPAVWIDEVLKLSDLDKLRYQRNEVYTKAKMPWIAYKNYWWILDETKGEFAAVGIHGQVIYINRAAKIVIAYFSSQPQASSVAGFKPFVSKLNACRQFAAGY